MDAFETVVASVLQRQGYWTLTSVKVDLTTSEKKRIGRPSCPRWELDIVAYRGRDNRVLVVECKSFLDSPGVECNALDGSKPHKTTRYKLFREPVLRRVVLDRLTQQLVSNGFCRANPQVQLCLAAGRIRGDDEVALREFFERKGWRLFGPTLLRAELNKLKSSRYENSVAAIVAKMLLREQRPSEAHEGIDADV